MTVRAAVATRDAAIEATPAPEPLHVLARKAIERQAVVLQQILPQHMSMARFEQIALAQVKGTPGLLRCFETPEGQVSLLYSVVQAAAAGLELGSVAQQAWLIPYKKRTKDGKTGRWSERTEARLQLSDRGVRVLARRDRAVRDLVADVVREGDHFVYRRTLDGDIFEHEVRGPSTRPLTHAYCLIRWADGGAMPIVLDRDEVLYIRDNYSEGYKFDLEKAEEKRTNPWITREWTMWKKTAIHQARRELNVSPEVAAVLASDADGNAAPVTAWPEVAPAPAAPELTPPADENGEPWPVDVVTDAGMRVDIPAAAADDLGLLNAALTGADPDPPASTDPDAVTVDDLIAALVAAGRVAPGAAEGNKIVALVAAAAELVGVKVAHPDELVADQAVAEELLAKLTPAAES